MNQAESVIRFDAVLLRVR